jgi:hypothetical protein
MIEFLNKDPRLTNTQSLLVSYPRTVQITFGTFPYVDDIHNMILEVKKNITEKDSYSTNVKGGKTDWFTFVDHPFTKKFFTYCINQHQVSHPDLFQYFLEKKEITEGWGNEIKKGDYVRSHIHSSYHCIFYLTEGNPLILPELNIKIIPKPGDYYFFPPFILHHVDVSESDKNRYNIIYNINIKNNWEKEKKMWKRNQVHEN